jgi:surface carbohydrate biosynthesis protein (TIGR04326 family)
MRSLLIFDGSFTPDNGFALDEVVDLFSLSGDFDLVSRVTDAVSASSGHTPIVLHSAIMINKEVDDLKKQVAGWAADVGDARLWGRSMKSWFLAPGGRTSTWWFSLISEKNTFKTDAFFNLARVAAVRRLVESRRYQRLVIALSDPLLEQSLRLVASEAGVEILCIKTRPAFVSFKDRVKSVLKRLGLLGDLAAAMFIFLRFATQSFRARRSLGHVKKRRPQKGSVLMAAYYPGVDPSAAEQGIFKSKYFPTLQDKMEAWGLHKVWLLIFLDMAGEPFSRCLDLIRRFNNRGERVFLLSEFLGIKELLKCLIGWCRQAALSPPLYIQARNALARTSAGQAGQPLLKRLWFQSFMGATGMEGICYYQAFTAVFRDLPEMKDVIYCMEMHAWEKGLIAATRQKTPAPRTIGFQHVAVSTNYFHFLYDPRETQNKQSPADLPLPDVTALTGPLIKDLFSGCRFPNVVMVESVRYLYVNGLISRESPELERAPVLLVAGSISKGETRTLANMVRVAFPHADSIKVWFKGHPACPFEDLFAEMKFDPREAGYEIKGGNIADALASARAVFVPTSTVSIESLVFGCKVLIPLVPDSMLMNPLADFPDYYQAVTSPKDLVEAVQEFTANTDARESDQKREFAKAYWLTDPDLPRWKEFIIR